MDADVESPSLPSFLEALLGISALPDALGSAALEVPALTVNRFLSGSTFVLGIVVHLEGHLEVDFLGAICKLSIKLILLIT